MNTLNKTDFEYLQNNLSVLFAEDFFDEEFRYYELALRIFNKCQIDSWTPIEFKTTIDRFCLEYKNSLLAFKPAHFFEYHRVPRIYQDTIDAIPKTDLPNDFVEANKLIYRVKCQYVELRLSQGIKYKELAEICGQGRMKKFWLDDTLHQIDLCFDDVLKESENISPDYSKFVLKAETIFNNFIKNSNGKGV